MRPTPASAMNTPASSLTPTRWQSILLYLSLLLFLALIVRRAWLSDDAYITFRTIDNFLHGYGLVWNVGERVQAYTHPLWLFLLTVTSWITGELVFTSMILSIVISLASAALLTFRVAVSRMSAFYVIFVLLLSNAFVDYSTSGLENPLSHLILVAFFALFFGMASSFRKLAWLSLLAGLGTLNRLDLMLIFLPVLAYAWYEYHHWKGILALLIGMAPLALWEIFSILYYGFPFPNTAYAKLNTGIPSLELARQGLAYLGDSLRVDPLTLIVTSSGIVLAFFSRDRRTLPIALGIVLYLLYVVKIGGDFMSGRFLAAPLLCALVIIARFDLSTLSRQSLTTLTAATFVLSLFSYTPTLNIFETYPSQQERSVMVSGVGIANERRFYSETNELLRIEPRLGYPRHAWVLEGLNARQAGSLVLPRTTVGMYGYYAGPQVYVVDKMALGDPLLARLPAERDLEWRIGHFRRTTPDGYIESLSTGVNQISDSSLAAYYDRLSRITRGRLFDPLRLREIWRMNSGQNTSLIDFDAYAYPKMVHANLDEVSSPKKAGARWDAPGNLIFRDSGLEIDVQQANSPTQIQLSLDGDNGYQLVYLKDGRPIARQDVPAASPQRGRLAIHCLKVPPPAAQSGFDKIRIFAISGDKQYSLGHFLFSCLSF